MQDTRIVNEKKKKKKTKSKLPRETKAIKREVQVEQ